jgi:hypothetical protein
MFPFEGIAGMALTNLTKVNTTVLDVPVASEAIKNDTSVNGVRVYVDAQDAAGKSYTDTKIDVERAYVDSIANGLSSIITSNFSVTAKTNAAQTWTYPQYFQSSIREKVTTANSGTSYTIDLSLGTIFLITLTANTTITMPALVEGQSFTLYLRQDATGNRTVTWAGGVAWANSTAPSITMTASRTDTFGFNAIGTKWIGIIGGKNYTGV